MVKYIAVKLVEAVPQEKDGEPGYKVKYPDGYTSWCPKATFEKANYPLSPDGTLSTTVVDNFIQRKQSYGLSPKTVATVVQLRNMYDIVEQGSCIDPADFNFEYGEAAALERATEKAWELLTFLLHFAKHGLHYGEGEDSFEVISAENAQS